MSLGSGSLSAPRETNRTSPPRNNRSNEPVYWPRDGRPHPVALLQGVSVTRREAGRFAVAPIIDADQGNGADIMQRSEKRRARPVGLCSVLAVSGLTVFVNTARAEQPPAPCHPNPTADADEAAVRSRGDVVNLPGPLQDRLAQLGNRPHTYLPLQAFNEPDGAAQ